MIRLIAAVLIVVAIVVTLILLTPSYEAQEKEYCKRFLSIPQKYLDRVPDGCLPYYFNVHNEETT